MNSTEFYFLDIH